MTDVLAISRLSWRKCYRIIPSRFPPVNLFDRIAPEKDSQILGEVETFTNDRVRQEIGEVQHVRPEDVVGGKGASYIMAPFTHPDPCGDRFSDGSYGVLYASESFQDAVKISIRRREEFLRHTNETKMQIQMRVLQLDLEGVFHDLRGAPANDYGDPSKLRTLARELRENGSYGLICDGSAALSGTHAVVFRPSVLSNCIQERHLQYLWDGKRITRVYDYSTGQFLDLGP